MLLFWGKIDKERYLYFTPWAKVSAPIEFEGLGFKNLTVMNNAMLLRNLWRLALCSAEKWVEIV